MLTYISVYVLFALVDCGQRQFTATKGYAWPEPRFETKNGTAFYTLEPSAFKINITKQSCKTLTQAVQRYFGIIKRRHASMRLRRRRLQQRLTPNYDTTAATEMVIELADPCEKYPYFNMNENYTLIVAKTVLLSSDSIWGVLRGLETFSQLVFISDEDRALLVDTARHYLPPRTIRQILDAMAMDKLNVFHWHLVDDQSFPFASEKFPELSEKGAYHPSLIYTKAIIEDIIEYARRRGIRVIPEFDIPGHSRSWSASHPEVMVQCRTMVLMNPIEQKTHDLLRELLKEAQEWFPDSYFHLGGDEVNHTCWYEDSRIENFLVWHNLMSSKYLQGLFMKKVVSYLKEGTVPIVWQDIFKSDQFSLQSSEMVVQVWEQSDPIGDTIRLLNSGHRVIFSSYWYLDNVGETFEHMYKDPREELLGLGEGPTVNAMNIIGGEACMWTEMADESNILSVIWPRASAMAEVLWSEPQYLYHARVEEHTCRMRARGIPAPPPNGPGVCLLDHHFNMA